MNKYIIFFLVTLLGCQVVSAESLTLKCITSDGERVEDLIIDLENNQMMWGEVAKYDIKHVNDTYISAYEKTDRVGGEVWVINRITGTYKRGLVGIFSSKPGGKLSLMAVTYEGRCVKPQF